MFKKIIAFTVLSLVIIGAMFAAKPRQLDVEWDGETILIDSTATADTSDTYYWFDVDSVSVYTKVFDGAGGNDTVIVIMYDVSPIDGTLLTLSEVDTFATDGTVHKTINFDAGYYGFCVVVNRIGTADAGDSVSTTVIPISD